MKPVAIRIGPRSYVELEFRGEALSELYPMLTEFLRPCAPMSSWRKYNVTVSRSAATSISVVGNWTKAEGDGFAFFMSRTLGGASFAFLWGDLPAYQVATPLRQLLAWIIDLDGGVLLHASAVYIGGRAVAVLAGPSGSGKSTLASRLADRSGNALGFLGDDWIPIYYDDGHWNAYPLYSSLKLSQEMAERMVRVDVWPTELAHKSKVVMKAITARPGEYRIGALFLPSIAASGLLVAKMSPFWALRRIAPSTLLQSSGVSENVLKRLSSFAREVPNYELSVSKGMIEAAVSVVEALT